MFLTTLDGFLTSAACARLAQSLTDRGFTPTGHAYPPGYRNNDRLVFDDPALAAELWSLAAPHVPATFEAAGARWRPVALNTRFRSCRYRDGQAFTIHRDGAFGAGARRSWLTLQIFVNDGFAGGRTRFYADATGATGTAAIEPRTGRAIVFDHRYWHDGEPVPTGEKIVLRTDVMFERLATLEAPRPALTRHDGYVWRIVERRDGSVVSSGRDGAVRSGHDIVYRTHDGSITGLAEDAAGRLWLGLRCGSLRCPEMSLDMGCGAAVLDVAALPHGGVAAALASGEVLVVGADGGVVSRAGAHSGWAWSLALAAERILSAGEDGALLAHGADARALLAPGGPALRAVAAGPDFILAGDAHGRVRALDASGRALWTCDAHTAAVTALAVRGERWLSGGEDGCVHVWRGARREATHTCDDFVRAVAFARGGAILFGGYDGLVVRRPYCSPSESSSGEAAGAGLAAFSGAARSESLGSPASGEPCTLQDTRPSGAV